MSSTQPFVLTQGDPAGVGPEITLKAWHALRTSGPAFCVVGCYDLLASMAHQLGMPAPTRIQTPAETTAGFKTALPVIDVPLPAPVLLGKPLVENANQVMACLQQAVGYALDQQVNGLITNPIAKSVLQAAGFAHPGHTEYLAHECGARTGHAPHPVMMLAAGTFRVSLVTIHTPLRDVASQITADRLQKVISATHQALKVDFGVDSPSVAVCGLNPHAGENGTIGTEERDIIIPALNDLRGRGLQLDGPLPADTLFHAEARAKYNGIVAMYHDQGLIPLKAHDFWGGVNITLGLPIIRTSPDHGTGFDIAGQHVARADSLINAIKYADTIASNRTRHA